MQYQPIPSDIVAALLVTAYIAYHLFSMTRVGTAMQRGDYLKLSYPQIKGVYLAYAITLNRFTVPLGFVSTIALAWVAWDNGWTVTAGTLALSLLTISKQMALYKRITRWADFYGYTKTEVKRDLLLK